MWTMSGSGVAKGVGMVTKLPRYLYQEENIKRRKNDRSLFLVVYSRALHGPKKSSPARPGPKNFGPARSGPLDCRKI